MWVFLFFFVCLLRNPKKVFFFWWKELASHLSCHTKNSEPIRKTVWHVLIMQISQLTKKNVYGIVVMAWLMLPCVARARSFSSLFNILVLQFMLFIIEQDSGVMLNTHISFYWLFFTHHKPYCPSRLLFIACFFSLSTLPTHYNQIWYIKYIIR